MVDIPAVHMIAQVVASGAHAMVSLQDPATFLVAANDAADGTKALAAFQCDGSADDVQIQAAIDALPAGGGKVVLSEGTFTIAATITLGENVTLCGHGPSSIIFLANSAGVDCIKASNVADLVVKDLAVDGNRDNNAGEVHGIHFQNVDRGRIDSVTVSECSFDGIRLDTNNCLDCTISNCICHDNDVMGIRTIAVIAVRIVGCQTRSNGDSGIDIDGFSLNVAVVGNTCFDHNASDGSGIFVEESSDNCAVVGNSCRNNINGINCNQQVAGTLEDLTVVGNNCLGNWTSGIRVRANTSGNLVRDVVLSGNSCFNNGTAGIIVGSAAGATLDNVLVIGNRCGDREASPSQDYGIQIDAAGTVTSMTVVDNDVEDNVTAGILHAGTAPIIRNNRGFVTENSGTATILSGTTSIVVTHGLSVTPTLDDISVVFGENSTNDPGICWISNITSTQFTINVRADPGASNLDLAWQAVVL
jgi:Right handed beta helix region